MDMGATRLLHRFLSNNKDRSNVVSDRVHPQER